MGQTWRTVRLGDLVRIKHGFPFRGEFFRETPTPYVLLTPGNFSIGGGFKGEKLKYYDGEVPESYVLEEGALVVTMTDLSKAGDTLGYPALVPSWEGVRFLHNQRLGLMDVVERDSLDARFLYYRLRARDYRHHVLAGATGSTVRHTSPTRIADFCFELPPLAEQRAISYALSTFDSKIQLSQLMNDTLEQMVGAIFKSWFIDFDPVHAKSSGRKPVGIPEELAVLFPCQLAPSPLGRIPQGWQAKPLDALANFLNGLALQKFPAREGEPWLPVIKIAELRAGRPSSSQRANRDVPGKYLINDGDLIFSWSGSLLVKYWTGGLGALNQHLFKVETELPRWFVNGWLQHHLPEFQSIASGKATTMGHIQRHHLTAAKSCLPPVRLLELADRVLGPLTARQVANEVEIRTLNELRDLLLPRLLSRELSVRTGAKVAESA